jgi:uncharacterized protein (TIGR03437 family)
LTINCPNRPVFRLLWSVLALGAASLSPAAIISGTRIYTQPRGASFYVDGDKFIDSATFLWPQGSKHTLNTDVLQFDPIIKKRYAFTQWTNSTGFNTNSSPVQIISGDPGITSYTAVFTEQYAVSLNFFACTGCGGSPGTFFLNDIPHSGNGDIYFDAGTVIILRAVPNPGFVFVGWMQGLYDPTQAYLTSITLNAPFFIFPKFVTAASVTVASDPPGLQILPDRTLLFAPVTFDWGVNTVHSLGAATPQTDLHGHLWVFDSWSDGGAATHDYTPGSQSSVTLTVKYVPGGRATFLTNPPGLKLSVDGRDNWPIYNFYWGAGTMHTVSVPRLQVDFQGHGWAFQSWSNGGPATQAIALMPTDVANGYRLTANFVPSAQTQGQITIQTLPAGLQILADGGNCVTPCVLVRTIGSTVLVSAPAAIQTSADTRMQFSGWTDGGTGDRSIIVGPDPQTFNANYQIFYRLAYTSDPPGGVTWQFTPAPSNAFFAAQSSVAVSVVAAPGFTFQQWQGDASGTSPNITLAMTRPLQIRARIVGSPNAGITAIRNGAGQTPEGAVAPGSIISIYGPNLAPWVQVGPASPLAQTLAGVTVTAGDELLPLLFVSPGQINAQLPSDLPDGDQTLTVHVDGQPDAVGVLKSQRNAPGLFAQQIADKAYLIALHEDGSLIGATSPARRGELVTALGTGFGPYKVQPLDGFAVPNPNIYPLIDTTELLVDGHIIQPEFGGAAVGRVGITALQFRIADPLPSGTTIELKARVNGYDSNTVLLPLR